MRCVISTKMMVMVKLHVGDNDGYEILVTRVGGYTKCGHMSLDLSRPYVHRMPGEPI